MLKTNKSVAKRMRFTAKGKIKRTRGNKGHLLIHKSHKAKRGTRKAGLVSQPDSQKIRRMLPYG